MTSVQVIPLAFTVNGREVRLDVEGRELLVHVLRERLKLTGTHVGCDTSQCGACTVLIDGDAVKACTVFAVQARGRSITTIEGLGGDDELHPLQAAFTACHGLQCGFCTPGFIMASVQILNRYPDPTDETIRLQLDGNICRCTGYQQIVRAVQVAAGADGAPRVEEA